jgi:1,2-phenylacetyl-CoA epoxidase catalytic subunit
VLGWTTHVLWKATKPFHERCDRVVTRERLTEELPDLLRGYVEGGAGMDAEAFVRELDAENQELLQRLTPESTLKPEVEGNLSVVNLLKVALKNEIEATETAARWMATTPEIDVKLALARQVGDEAKHYRLIADRLEELGFDARNFDPLAKGYGPLFEYLESLRTTIERVAAGQFTREAIAIVKNRQFIEFCEAAGDESTARLYREVIEPDERHHHELGRRLLLRYATTLAAQDAARRAATRTLELAEELQGLALRTGGIHHAPGC